MSVIITNFPKIFDFSDFSGFSIFCFDFQTDRLHFDGKSSREFDFYNFDKFFATFNLPTFVKFSELVHDTILYSN